VRFKWGAGMKRWILRIGVILGSLILIVGLVIGICTYRIEHSTIYKNQPIIYTRFSQYKQLYDDNKKVFNDIVEKLKANEIDYGIALIDYDGNVSIRAEKSNQDEVTKELLKNKPLIKDLNFIAKKLKINYIDFLPTGDKDGMTYSFTRRDYSSGHNNYIGIRYLKNYTSDDVDSIRRIDNNWLCFQNTDLDNYPFYRRVYDAIYNN
jgi:hypothetical protein